MKALTWTRCSPGLKLIRSAAWIVALAGLLFVVGPLIACASDTRDDAAVAALVAAVTPTQADRAAIEIARTPDGRPQITLRGDAFDGRHFLKALLVVLSADHPANSPLDLDLDIKVAALQGFNGEALHDAALKLSGQGGEVRSFALSAGLGGGDLAGDLRSSGSGRPLIHLKAKNAGSFLRFVGVYRRMRSGEMSFAIVVPTSKGAPREGVLEIRKFGLVGERALRPLARSRGRHGPRERLEISRLRLGVTSSPSLVTVNDGILLGTTFGATATGTIDLAHDRVALHGVAIPLWGDTQRAAIIPEPPFQPGLIGSTYTLEGPPQAPLLTLGPVAMLPPGVLRKLFGFALPDDQPP